MGARFMPFGTCLSSYRNGWLWRSLSLLSCILYGIGPLSGRMRSAGSVFLFTEVIRDRTKPVWLAGEALFTKGMARPCQGTVGEVCSVYPFYHPSRSNEPNAPTVRSFGSFGVFGRSVSRISTSLITCCLTTIIFAGAVNYQ